MAPDRPSGAAARQLGKAKARTWQLVRSPRRVPDASTVPTGDGRLLVRDPVGFPHQITLACHSERLGEAAKVRLMKAFALAVERERAAGRTSITDAAVRIVVDEASRGGPVGGPVGGPGPTFTLSPRQVERMNRSLAHLRAAVFALVEASPGLLRPRPQPEPAAASRPAPAKVLLFKNIFTKDVGGADALQLNPGVHYLLSPLARRGVRLVLLDGKLPLQDVCEVPPQPEQALALEQCITDPDELEGALRRHRDLNLVCLTLLERSFGQIRGLCRFIRRRSQAFIAVGGVFPTVTPEHAFVHLPEANFVVRGDGEEVLPAIVDAVAGRRRAQGLDEQALEHLRPLAGLFVRSASLTLSLRSDRVNRVADLDQVPLDFSVLDRENVSGGLSLSTSRGCIYGCHFCSVMDKHLWRGKSVDAVMGDLEGYQRRLVELYGSAEQIPAAARRLQLWDDDFFLDADRAMALMGRLTAAGFAVSFIQGTVSSFFRKQGRRIGRELNQPLIDAIPTDLLVDQVGLKLGTENFCDRELRRLGKPYDVDRIRRLASALARRGIRQEHFRILCNRQTTLDDLLDNFETLTELRWAVGPDFFVLAPSWLIHLFPTALYRAAQVRGTDRALPTAGALRVEHFAEFDYPFVLPERPERSEVFEIVRRFPAGMHFGAAGEPGWMFEGVHGPDDDDYLAVYGYVRRALIERRDALRRAGSGAAPAELYRIEQALATRLGGERWIPAGALGRVAPRLRIPSSAGAEAETLARYVEAILAAANAEQRLALGYDVTVGPEGVSLEVERDGGAVRFLVERSVPGAPAAFHSKNLAFVARSSFRTEAERRAASAVIETVRHAVTSRDRHELC